MMKRSLIFLFSLLSFITASAQIVYSDYSDPDVCEGTNGDYWLTASSFQCTPGLPILHSTDLVHWTLVNYALEKLIPEEHYNSVQHGNGVWAPSIRLHNGTYYIYWGDPDFGVYMVKTTDPQGKWDEPVLVVPGKGIIDTTPLWDEDDRCYLVNGWANSRCGFNSILTVRELSADGTHAIGQPRMIYDGYINGDHTLEGPKFYKQNGYYYILAPAGSVTTGWTVALRSKNVYGPYENKIVFNKDGIHQGGWVKDKFVCFQEVGAYGRILHLLDVNMKNDWPMMTINPNDRPSKTSGKGLTANTPKGSYPLCTNLVASSPYLAYQWHSNYQEHYGFPTTSGTRVYAYNMTPDDKNLWDVPNLYLRKFDGETFSDTLRITVTAKAAGDESGVVVMGRDYCRLSVAFDGKEFSLNQITCIDAEKHKPESSKQICKLKTRTYGSGAKQNFETSLSIIVTCAKGALCSFAYSTDGGRHFTSLPDSFQAREGKWIGAKYGVFSIAPEKTIKGWIDLQL